MSQERRKFPRVTFDLEIAIAAGDDQKLEIAKLEDLTVEGAAFQSHLNLPAGSGVYVLFPGKGSFGENEIPAEVLRCQETQEAGEMGYIVAVRFIEFNDSYLMDVMNLVHGDRVNAQGEKETSFLEKVGGRPTVDRVYGQLYDRLYAHSWLKGFFKNADKAKLVAALGDFMSRNMGDQAEFKGNSPIRAHKHAYITEEINTIRSGLLEEVLQEAGLPDDQIAVWLHIEKAFKASVLKVDSSQCMKRFDEDEILIVPKPE